MPQPEAAKAIEAILMVAQEPVDPHLLAQLLEIAPAAVDALCQQLQAAYTADDRGFVLAKVAGGYRFQSHGDLAAYVERFVLEGQTARLSAAALETLAIVAYKQPLSRAQVAAIRGVNVDGVMRTLQQRGYVEEVGRDPGPGQATLFGTSRAFLERLGLDRLSDLPPIADLFPSTDIMEALERGLRADRPEPEPTPDTLPLESSPTSPLPGDPGPGSPAAPVTTHQDDVVDHGEVVAPESAAPHPDLTADPDELHDDLQPPAWAVDPAPEAAPPAPSPDPAPSEAEPEPDA